MYKEQSTKCLHLRGQVVEPAIEVTVTVTVMVTDRKPAEYRGGCLAKECLIRAVGCGCCNRFGSYLLWNMQLRRRRLQQLLARLLSR